MDRSVTKPGGLPLHLAPVPVTPGPERAAEILREWIIGGLLRRGQDLVTADLAHAMRTSQATAGKALSRLMAQGFATRSRRAILVAPLQLEAHGLLANRLKLEPDLTGLAARRITHFGLYRLERLHGDMIEARRRNDILTFQRCNYRFHVDLYRLAARPDDLQQIQTHWSAFPFDMLTALPGRMAAVLEEHSAILQALQDGDPRQASRTMREHIQQGWQAFLRHYPRCPTTIRERKRAATAVTS